MDHFRKFWNEVGFLNYDEMIVKLLDMKVDPDSFKVEFKKDSIKFYIRVDFYAEGQPFVFFIQPFIHTIRIDGFGMLRKKRYEHDEFYNFLLKDLTFKTQNESNLIFYFKILEGYNDASELMKSSAKNFMNRLNRRFKDIEEFIDLDFWDQRKKDV